MLSMLKKLAVEGLIDYKEATKAVDKLCKKHIGAVV